MKQFRTYQLAKELFHDLKLVKLKGAMRDPLAHLYNLILRPGPEPRAPSRQPESQG